ncbi:lipocalin family protein [Emticicia sp. SJ17W-69]|uniref:lipocalin family protein n=1 Tax=Emticicia sp. SJ17W-69 TaxID=3421657 RepID=UPI003EBEF031
MKISSNFRKVVVLLVLSSLAMAVMNCSKSDSDTPSAQIEGTWKISGILVKEGTKPETDQFPLLLAFLPCFKDVTFTFKSNGDLTASVPAACQATADDFIGTSGTAKYEVKSGKLTITDTDGTTTTEDVTFSGNQMTWSSSETTAGVVTTTKVVLTKQ